MCDCTVQSDVLVRKRLEFVSDYIAYVCIFVLYRRVVYVMYFIQYSQDMYILCIFSYHCFLWMVSTMQYCWIFVPFCCSIPDNDVISPSPDMRRHRNFRTSGPL